MTRDDTEFPAHHRWLHLLPCVALSLTIWGFLQSLPAHAQTTVDCEQAGQAAEAAFGLPSGLLLAIGRVESGRWDSTAGRVVPWPWSIDVDGVARTFDNATEAVSETRAIQSGTPRDIDVGCFQISLLYHPAAFADLNEAFDPVANANYAARYLVTLKNHYGSWQQAVAMYHSADPELGGPYRERVFATWPDAPGAETVSAGVPQGLQFPGFPGIHLWVPGRAGADRGGDARAAEAGGAADASLPHVITP